MPIPKLPNPIPRPWASEGDYVVIPDNQSIAGRASYKHGFPVETQKPENDGGVAPNRVDFNGAYHQSTSVDHWIQSGGQWLYNSGLNYTSPAMVIHNGVFWFCLKENGPESANGVVAPGVDESYWVTLLTALENGGGGTGTLPVGFLGWFYGITPPPGWFAMNGTTFSAVDYPKLAAILGGNITPNWSGCFLRNHDPKASRDPNGATRKLGDIQGDAMRNFTGTFVANAEYHGAATGVFTRANYGSAEGWRGDFTSRDRFTLNPSRQVPTSTENRPVNAMAILCIKHD